MSKLKYLKLLIKYKWNMLFQKKHEQSVFVYEAEKDDTTN